MSTNIKWTYDSTEISSGWDINTRVLTDTIREFHSQLARYTGIANFKLELPVNVIAGIGTDIIYTPYGAVQLVPELSAGADINMLNARIKELEKSLSDIETKGDPF